MATAQHDHTQDVQVTSEASFKHVRLANNSTQIRLLHIQGRLEDDEIRCSIQHFCLDSPPPYIALSYRWNTTNDRLPVRIGNEVFQAVPNAWLALQCLGLQAGTYIWVDSICVDQNDVDERNNQVGLMSRIYSTATEVYVWLGLETRHSETAFEALQSAVRFEAIEIDCKSMERYCLALQQLFSNEYWSRTWIVQEVIFARKIIIACGQLRITWDLLETFFAGVLPRWQSSLSLKYTPRLAASIKSVSDASAHVLVRSRTEYRKQQRDSKRFNNFHLYEFLQSHYRSKCLDPRDKIYGLLGLFNELALAPMEIDYSKMAEDLLIVLLSYILEEHGAAFLLVVPLLGSLLGVKPFEAVFQNWLSPRLRLRTKGEYLYFQCHSSPTERHNLPIAVATCLSISSISTADLLDLQGVSLEEIECWMEPFSQRKGKLKEAATLLWREQVPLRSYIRDVPTSACHAIKQPGVFKGTRSLVSPNGGRYPGAVIDCMIRAYSDGAPLSACNSPKVFIDDQGHIGVACSKSRPGDIICSFIPGQNVHDNLDCCILRPSRIGYEVIGSALVLPWTKAIYASLYKAQQPAPYEHKSRPSAAVNEVFGLYLDPQNALSFCRWPILDWPTR